MPRSGCTFLRNGNATCVGVDAPLEGVERRPADRDADDGLQDELLAPREPPVLLARHLAPVVAGADPHREHRRAERDPDVAVREVREQERRHDDREVDQDPAHRGRSRLRLVGLRAFRADGLADLARAEPADESRAEEDREEQRHERRVRRAERDVAEDAEDRHLAEERVEEPRDHRASPAARSSRSTARSSNGMLHAADHLGGLVALAGDEDDVARPRVEERLGDGGAAVGVRDDPLAGRRRPRGPRR